MAVSRSTKNKLTALKTGSNLLILLNAAKRQTIPAFREKGVWKIESGM